MLSRTRAFLALLSTFVVVLSALVFVPPTACRWQLTFADEFKGAKLDATRWNTAYPSGSNGEQQFYAPDAFTVRDGVLNIEARPRPMEGYAYTSGIITTQQTFSQQYGFFEIRAQLPRGQGLWPAFWILPAEPNVPWEVDIFEMHGHLPDNVYMANHWMDGNGEHAWVTRHFTGPDFTTGFHTFGLEWNPSELIWYVDGVAQARTREGVPAQSMFLLANLAVGGTWPGFADETTPFPSTMDIDYIRVWKQACWQS